MEGLLCGFYHEGERLSELLGYLCWIPLGSGSFQLSCCTSEGLLRPAAVEGDFLLSALAAKWRAVLLLLLW